MSRLLAIIAAVAALAAAPASAESFTMLEPMDNGQIVFTMPSGNIGCIYTPEGGTDIYMPVDDGPELICERVQPRYVTVILGPFGEPEVIANPGEQGCCGAENIFHYGHVLELDGFTCWSARTGLTCERYDGVGFSMARAGIEVFGD